MGRRYTEEEKRHIQELVDQGHTDEAISQQLGCSINAFRNIRHRTNIKTREIQTIQQLHEERYKLTQQTQELGKKTQPTEEKTRPLENGTLNRKPRFTNQNRIRAN